MRTRAGAGNSRNPATTATPSGCSWLQARRREVSHCLAMLPSARRATSTAAYPPGPPGLPAQGRRSEVECEVVGRSHDARSLPNDFVSTLAQWQRMPLQARSRSCLSSEAQATGARDKWSIRAACQPQMTTRALRGYACAAHATSERSSRGDGRGNGRSRRASVERGSGQRSGALTMANLLCCRG